MKIKLPKTGPLPLASCLADRLCVDLDEDCEDIAAEGHATWCYLYAPEKGRCPFLKLN